MAYVPKLVALSYPQRKDEVIAFVKKHHYSGRCPGVWKVSYAWLNDNDKIQAVAIYGPPPYPAIATHFTFPAYVKKVAWQARMVGAGISAAQLDDLISFAGDDLYKRGFFWQLTMTDPTARMIDNLGTKLSSLVKKAFSGEVYQRNGWFYMGTTKQKTIEAFLIDNKLIVHPRQAVL